MIARLSACGVRLPRAPRTHTIGRRRRTSHSLWAQSVTLLGIAASFAGCGTPSARTASGAFVYRATQLQGTLIAVGNRSIAGDLRGETIADGTRYALRSDLGRIVVLNYFASWCGPCQREMPGFQSVYLATRSRGVSFVGLDVKDPSRSAATAWLRDKGISFPVVFDVPARTAQQLGGVPVAALPNTVLIDRHGRVAAVYAGPTTAVELRDALALLLAEH